ncbi:MAG: wax ester/triacylglycerol synthase family O-acyltransferase, partial [Myxococcota bacterium]
MTHFTGVAIYDPSTAPGGKVRFKDIIAHVASRIHVSPIFRQKLVRVPGDLDYPYWADDDYFDLEYHLRHSRLPEPGDWRQFCIHLARYHSRPLNMQRPLWEMYVIEGLDRISDFPEGSYAIATKVHHAALDGGSAMRFLGALSDIDNQGTPALAIDAPNEMPGKKPRTRELLARAVGNNARFPLRLARRVAQTSPLILDAMRSAVASAEPADPRVPVTRFDADHISPHKMFDATSFPLDELRRIKRAVDGATVNDVVLTICSGALRAYLEHHDELPEIPLVAWVPINAKVDRGEDMGGNHIAAMTASLQTHLDDPVERLRRIRDASRRSKEAKAGLSARIMTDLTQHVPAATQLLASRLLLQPSLRPHLCNLFVSNVPGPQVPLYANGARLV